MANFRVTASKPVLLWLDQLPIPPNHIPFLTPDATPSITSDMEDPHGWDIDRVVQELCTPQRSWEPRASMKALPAIKSTELETKLREEGVDGCILLIDVSVSFGYSVACFRQVLLLEEIFPNAD
jgi:hypothetical protein